MMIKKKTSVQLRFFTGPWKSDFSSPLLMLPSCEQNWTYTHFNHKNFCQQCFLEISFSLTSIFLMLHFTPKSVILKQTISVATLSELRAKEFELIAP
jgi:hypothetical protein